MVSNQTTYRHLSPTRYRRQTLAVYQSTQSPNQDEDTHQPEATLNRKWVHRSVGDLSSNRDLHIPDPRSTSTFYRQLYEKYPYAFQHHRPEQREATRRVFNSQHHVRFEDTELYDEKLYKDPFTVRKHDLSRLTNWDKEVGHYFRNGSNVRECMTSAETSEIGGPTKMRQFSSDTLNRLLNEKSPLRRKFQDGPLSTRSELDIQDYFLEKSKARSRHRKKRCRVLQRKIDKDDKTDLYAKENTPSQENLDNLNTETKMSGFGKRTCETQDQTKRVDVDKLMANTDLKIDTLLEKISLKMSSPESLPDSAIDVDTPSVQSFVSADKGGHSDTNQYSELPNLKNSAINRNGASRSLENGLDFYERELKRLQAMNGHIDRYSQDEHAEDSDEQETVIEINKHYHNNSDRTHTQSNSSSQSASQNQGLLQIYVDQTILKHSVRSEKSSDNFCNVDTGILGEHLSADKSEENMSETSSTMGSLSSEVQSVQSCVERPVYTLSGSQSDVAIATGSKGQRDSDVDSGIGQSSSGTDVRERGRSRGRTQTNIMKTNQSILPSRSEVDCCIMDEVNLLNSDHLVSHQRENLNETDDTADVRLGVQKLTEEEVRIAEKYRRTRSPSPYVLTSTRRLSVGRPNSAPCLVKGNYDMQVVDISISEKPENSGKNSPKQNKNTSCQNGENSSNGFIDHVKSGSFNTAKNSDNENMYEDVFRQIPNSRRNGCAVGSTLPSETAKINSEHLDTFIPDLPREYNNDDEDIEQAYLDAFEQDTHASIHTVKILPKHYDNEYARNSNNSSDHSKKVSPFCSDQTNYEDNGVNTSYERRYKPGVTSPRVKEKREKMRNKMKTKSDGSLQGANVKHEQNHNASDPVRLTGILTNGKRSDSRKPTTEDERHRHDINNDINNDIHDAIESDKAKFNVNHASSRRLNDIEHVPNNRLEVNADVHLTIPSEYHKPDPHDHKDTNYNKDIGSDSGVRVDRNTRPDVIRTGESETHPKAPPVKPARTKRKKTLPSDMNISDYKIMPSEAGAPHSVPVYQADNAKHIESYDDRPKAETEAEHRIHTGKGTNDVQSFEERQPKHQTGKRDTQPEAKSNLESSRHLSASRVSLMDKVGNLKTATKGKFKKLRKAMSLERGLDDCGVEMDPDPHGTQSRSHDNKGGHSIGHKMKKAPSLKSLTSLFGKLKKKKGKWSSEEVQREGIPGMSGTSQQPGQLSVSKRQQWASCHSLSTNTGSTHTSKPIGKLLELNKDGSQVIQLNKPASGPIGFFIARGTNKHCHGIFVSRIAETAANHSFAGLLEVGDEILEVNGRFVRDLSQDAVYDLISARPVVVLKILPIIARKDIT